MTSLEEMVDPRIAVLIVWAIFFFVFIVLPSLCIRCLGCCSPNVDGRRIDVRSEDVHDGWDRYMFLSTAKREKIDDLRCEGIRRCLGKFSLLLDEGHMLCLNEDGEEVVAPAVASPLSGDDDEERGGCSREEADKERPSEPPGRDMANPDDYNIDFDEWINMDPPQDKVEEIPNEEEKEGGSSSVEETGTKGGIIDVVAPAGHLGIAFESESVGLCIVTSVRENSPLLGKIHVGDEFIAVDDVQLYSASAILESILSKIDNSERKITILRGRVEDDVENEADGESNGSDYTHVRIPCPGYDRDGIKVMEKPPPTEEIATSISHGRRFPLFRHKVEAVDNAQRDVAEGKDAEDAADMGAPSTADVERNDEQRNVPHFCAICLGEYEASETISWSSNAECTHVFHQECIVKWLGALGRKAGVRPVPGFLDDPGVLRLLDYRLECPCCRQEFVSGLVLADEECYGDENV